MNFKKFFSVLSLTIVAILMVTSCKCDKKKVVAEGTAVNAAEVNDSLNGKSTTAAATLDADGNYVKSVGDSVDVKLPNGTTFKVGNQSTEYLLFSDLNNKDFKVSEDKAQGWITLDRTFFKSGAEMFSNPALTDVQLKNISEILKAFPNAKVKLGGYTDNTGAAAGNMKISAMRAAKVKSELEKLGVVGTRIESEGYGASHFLCEANDTDACKAQNRRVDIRVTAIQ